MRIGVDARELTQQPAGKGQYLLRLLSIWQHNPTVELVLYVRPGTQLPEEIKSKSVLIVEQGGKGPLWHWKVGRRLRQDGVQVFFAALSYLSALCNPVPTVTVVHDLAVFKLPGLAHNKRAFWVERVTLRRSMAASAHIIAVSQSTLKDLQEETAIDSRKLSLVYEAPLLQKVQIRSLSERKPYILFVGTLEPRKNVSTLLRAYAGMTPELRKDHSLYLAGKKGWGTEDYEQLAAELGIKENVSFLGYVDNQDMPKLYQEAQLFAYPSLYEGFGLPLAEALAMGTPAVTSNVSSLPEVGGEAALYCSPKDDKTLAKHLEKLLTDSAVWEKCHQAALMQAKKFSWEEAATQTLAVLESQQ